MCLHNFPKQKGTGIHVQPGTFIVPGPWQRRQTPWRPWREAWAQRGDWVSLVRRLPDVRVSVACHLSSPRLPQCKVSMKLPWRGKVWWVSMLHNWSQQHGCTRIDRVFTMCVSVCVCVSDTCVGGFCGFLCVSVYMLCEVSYQPV